MTSQRVLRTRVEKERTKPLDGYVEVTAYPNRATKRRLERESRHAAKVMFR